MAQLESFFPGPEPVASLLHGDLWSGNYNFDCAGQPMLFDPAVYYGDRETDIAMTRLFGGFSAVFYAAYREAYPLDPQVMLSAKHSIIFTISSITSTCSEAVIAIRQNR